MSEIDVKNNEGFDTDQQYIAGVYAKSLIDATEKSGSTEEVLLQLDSFVSTFFRKFRSCQQCLGLHGSPEKTRTS